MNIIYSFLGSIITVLLYLGYKFIASGRIPIIWNNFKNYFRKSVNYDLLTIETKIESIEKNILIDFENRIQKLENKTINL